MNNGIEIAVTLRGKNLEEIVSQAKTILEMDEAGDLVLPKTASGAKRGRKAAAATVEETIDDVVEETDFTEAGDETDGAEEITEDFLDEPPPKKTAAPKANGKTKLTEKDVNTAAMAHAKKHGRKATFEILKTKFKVASIIELKPEQFAVAVQALRV